MARRRRSSRADVFRRLRSVDLFTPLGNAALEQIAAAGRIERLTRGAELFSAGDPPDRIHLILSGTLEIRRPTPDHPEPTPVAYLSAGEMIGDMALLTETVRRSSGCVPEEVRVWTLERKDFERLTCEVEGYGMALAQVFARRHEAFITHLRREAPEEGLAGRIEHFDLPTVVQTLVSSRQTGVFSIANDDGRNVARVLFVDGEVKGARYGEIEGEEAFYEIFLYDGPGEFHFRGAKDPDLQAIGDVAVAQPAMSLLMEAMRLVDEVAKMRERVPSKALKATGKAVDWQDETTAAVAEAVLAALQKPRPLADLKGEITCPTYTLYEVALRLLEAGALT